MSKYYGDTERQIRELFDEARKEQDEVGDESLLHTIIIDEIDAIARGRGSSTSDIGDSAVNQLLDRMDGTKKLNNILVIGMTNRLSLLDDALLRPGRFEIHLEIGLPDEAGRNSILKIHTGSNPI
jgi:vesicle-fusing ATPase